MQRLIVQKIICGKFAVGGNFILMHNSIRCKARRIAIICENFFNGKGGSIDGKECHELEYYYLMDVPVDSAASEKTDESEKLVWIPIEDFAKNDIRPAFLKEKLKEVIEGGPLIHVINDER